MRSLARSSVGLVSQLGSGSSTRDGTGFFTRGDPNWRIHIALEVQGTTEVALVTSPALRRCWWFLRVVLATRGEQDAAPQGQYDIDAR